MPLASLKTCYEAEFQPFEVNNEEGVPLEHLVTAVNGVSIQISPASGIKVLIVSEDTASEDVSYRTPSVRAPSLIVQTLLQEYF